MFRLLLFLIALSLALSQKVKVTAFYESLCPYCELFFRTQLEPAYRKVGEIMEIESIAYGNVYEDVPNGAGYNITCQHGSRECKGNMIINCAHKYIPDYDKFLEYNFCIMNSDQGFLVGDVCAEKLSIDYGPIKECVSSVEGEILLHEAGVYQNKMVPGLDGVPYVMINGKPSDDADGDLIGVVCSTYTGNFPSGCPSNGVFSSLFWRRFLRIIF